MKLGQSVMRRKWKSYRVHIATIVATLVMLLATFLATRPAAHAQAGDWTTYMMNNARTGFNSAETIINTSSAPNLKRYWTLVATAGRVTTQPLVANGMVYWGSWDGVEHATYLNGKPAWSMNLGQTITCYNSRIGVASSGVVTTVLINGVTTTVLLVPGGDVNLYALDANTGAVLWKTLMSTQPQSFLFSPPAVFNGSVYIGISSTTDCKTRPQGQLVQVNASTGTIQNTFDVMAGTNCTGGSVWTSPTIDEATGKIYFTTAEKATCAVKGTLTPLATALVELNTSDLSFVASWKIPKAERIPDSDFASTPTLYTTTINGTFYNMLGVENKAGFYYAFDRTNIAAGPLWQVRLAVNPGPSISSSAWDGNTLYIAAGNTTINGTSCPGSLTALNPASGAILWQDCLPADTTASVTAVPGVIELGAGQFLYLFDASNGNQLFSFQDTRTNSNFMGPGSISNGVLYQGNADGRLYAFKP